MISSESGTRLRDFFVRVAAVYFGLHAVGILFDGSYGPRRMLEATWGKLAFWFAHNIFGVPVDRGPATPLETISQHVLVLIIAIVVASLWLVIDNRRSVTEKAHRAMRLALRYYVGIITMIYAGAKVVPMQFRPPPLEAIAQPFGQLTPMSLLWNFMGYSPAYTMFTGFGEWIGAFLLFFRRTTTLGALILIAVYSNVVLLNYGYAVFVKTLSTNLLIASVVLLAPDIARVVRVFVLNQPVGASPLGIATFGARMSRIRKYVKPMIVAVASVGPVVVSGIIYSTSMQRSALYGIYHAEPSSAVTPPVKSIVFDRLASFSIITSDDSVHRFRASIDTMADTVRYWARSDKADARTMRVKQVDSMTLQVLNGLQGVDSVATFRKVPLSRYPLLQPFRWR